MLTSPPLSACAQVGGYISIIGLVTYVAKERLYLSEPLMALVFGIIGEQMPVGCPVLL
jgi:hypothetical protein